SNPVCGTKPYFSFSAREDEPGNGPDPRQLSRPGEHTPLNTRTAPTKSPEHPIRESAFANLQAPPRRARAPVDPTDASEEREASGRRRIALYDSRKTTARPARNS